MTTCECIGFLISSLFLTGYLIQKKKEKGNRLVIKNESTSKLTIVHSIFWIGILIIWESFIKRSHIMFPIIYLISR